MCVKEETLKEHKQHSVNITYGTREDVARIKTEKNIPFHTHVLFFSFLRTEEVVYQFIFFKKNQTTKNREAQKIVLLISQGAITQSNRRYYHFKKISILSYPETITAN